MIRPDAPVGLLLCDHLDPEVIAEHGDYTELFPNLFEPLVGELTVYDVTAGEFPDSARECRGWIVSGSRHSAYDDLDWIARLEELVRGIVSERVPLVGICFGHQVIARALGGDVDKAEVGWGLGAKTFKIIASTGAIEGTMTLLMSHQDQVTAVPEGATVFATSEYCPVGGYRIDDRVLCVQGHPEFVPELLTTLLERRRGIIDGDVIDEALAGLDRPLDHQRVARWMAQVLT